MIKSLAASITAWSPFTPGNSHDSSLPVAMLEVTLRNTSLQPVEFALAANTQYRTGKINEVVREAGFRPLPMRNGAIGPDDTSMALTLHDMEVNANAAQSPLVFLHNAPEANIGRVRSTGAARELVRRR